ncbi:hypothetical protein DFH09DRAFT_1189401 [Mycena vulgaris]|nr:hypothetical protein DFH09DRAFT_1189401 [Mycena vulgaris]
MASLPSTLTHPHPPAPPSRLSLATTLYTSSSPRTTTLRLRATRSACAALAPPTPKYAAGLHWVHSPLHLEPGHDCVRSLDRVPCTFYRARAPRSARAALARPRTGDAPGVCPVHHPLPFGPASDHVCSLARAACAFYRPRPLHRRRRPCAPQHQIRSRAATGAFPPLRRATIRPRTPPPSCGPCHI